MKEKQGPTCHEALGGQVTGDNQGEPITKLTNFEVKLLSIIDNNSTSKFVNFVIGSPWLFPVTCPPNTKVTVCQGK